MLDPDYNISRPTKTKMGLYLRKEGWGAPRTNLDRGVKANSRGEIRSGNGSKCVEAGTTGLQNLSSADHNVNRMISTHPARSVPHVFQGFIGEVDVDFT